MSAPFSFLWLRLCFALAVSAAAIQAAETFRLSAAEQAWVQSHPVIRIQMGDNSPPFEFRENGVWQGLAYEQLQAACKLLGVRLVIQDISWDDAIAGIGSGTGLDLILAVTRSPEREEQMLLTNGYLSFPQVVIADHHRGFIGGLADLQHAVVTVESGYIMEDWLRRDLPEASLLTPNDSLTALKLVSDNYAAAYVGNLAVASWLIDRHGLINLGVVAPSGYGEEVYAMGVRKDWTELVGLLNRAFTALPENEQQAMRARWLAVRYDHGLRYRDIAFWVLGVVIVALLFVVQLKRMVARRTRELADEVGLRRERETELDEAQRIAHLGSWSRFTATGELTCSPGFYAILGLPSEAPISLATLMELVHPADRERLLAAHRTEGGGSGPEEFVYRITRSSGEVRHLLRRSTVFELPDPGTYRAQGVVLDITDRTRMEDRLRQAQRMEALGQLAGSVAHDFNNALTCVSGCGELIKAQTDQSQIHRLTDRLATAVEQGSALTGRLLAFARQGSPTATAFDLHRAIQATIGLFSTAKMFGIEIRTDLHATQSTVNGFPGQCESAFLNLFMNARDAMPKGGQLAITSYEEVLTDGQDFAPYELTAGRYVRLDIADTGHGMEPSVLARCLEPLFTTKGDKGTGLGLSSVHACLIDHHGALRITSTPGQGTTFSLWLPLVSA